MPTALTVAQSTVSHVFWKPYFTAERDIKLQTKRGIKMILIIPLG